MQTNIKSLIENWQPNLIKTAHELTKQGYYEQLLDKYAKAGWLSRPSNGIYMRPKDRILWIAAIDTIQRLDIAPIHVGALSALKFHNIIQYMSFNEDSEKLFILNTSDKRLYLPRWFNVVVTNYIAKTIKLFSSNQFGFVDYTKDYITIKISSPERAILELLSLVPNEISYNHAYELVENARMLNPKPMQQLLEDCVSIKVKRLFLYLAETHNLPCLKYLDINKINLGSGKRVIAEGGKYIPKYQISVPQALENEEGIG